MPVILAVMNIHVHLYIRITIQVYMANEVSGHGLLKKASMSSIVNTKYSVGEECLFLIYNFKVHVEDVIVFS